MVSIVSTAQANLLDEDAYNKKVRPNNRSCGVWGTAFFCLNLKGSVIVIAIIYGIMHLFSNIGILILGMTSHLNINNHGGQQLMKNLLLFISSLEKTLLVNFNRSNIFSQIVVGSKFLRILSKILEVSCYTHGLIFIFGMLAGILGWFWLTAILLVTLWVESIRSVSSIVYITYLLVFILKNWYFKISAVLISVALLLVTYSFSYYSIQIVYSLYLVQLAGGRGNEYVAYYKLRRLFQNIGVTNSSKLSNTVMVEKNLIKNTDECSSLIRVNQDTYSNV